MIPVMTNLALASTWTLDTFLANLKSSMTGWVDIAITIIGIVLLAVGVWKIAQGLISHGKTQVNWFVCAALIIVGAFLLTASVTSVANIGNGGIATIEGLGGTP